MKQVTLASAGILVLVGTLLAAGWVAAAGLPEISPSERHIRVTSTYQTTDSPRDVLAGYGGRYQPEPGRHKSGQCIVLRNTNSFIVLHQTILVTLCPSGNGTRVVTYRELYLRP